MASIAQEDRAPMGCPTVYFTAFGIESLGIRKPHCGPTLGVKYSLETRRVSHALPKSSPKTSDKMEV